MTKVELLAAIADDRARLERLLGSLDDHSLSAAPRDGGWAVKDHLSHMAAWERMIVAHLRDGSDAAVAGMDDAAYAAATLDELNEHAVPPASWRFASTDVRTEFAAAHAAIVDFVETMPEERLAEVYWGDDPSGRTVLDEDRRRHVPPLPRTRRWISDVIAAVAEA